MYLLCIAQLYVVFLAGLKVENKHAFKNTLTKFSKTYVVRCAIWYHSYNLKNVKNSHGRVLTLVKLQA